MGDLLSSCFSKSEIEQSISRRFERTVLKYADRLAIRMDGRQLTYSELNCFSNLIGKELLKPGGPREVPVALLMAQGIPLIAAILGVLKAGHIYVPIDPADSPERISSLLAEAGTTVVITDSVHAATTQRVAGERCRIFNVDSIAQDARADNLGVDVSPDDAAYIYYTSGSTGRPKGVVDSHRNVLHNIMRYTNNLRISCDDRLTLLQACNFSGSVSSMFCALLNGAALFPFDVRRSGVGALADLLVTENVTIYHSVPSLFEQLLMTGRQFPKLRVARLEGDRCERRHVELYRQYLGTACVLAIGLGATETGLTHQYLIRPDTHIDSEVIPVGYPTEDMHTAILDDQGQSMPPGKQGEIAIRSAYLAKGYWKNDELTRKSFESIPGEGRRQYRTGDVGRITADGKLEHLGRKDFQVRIRGHAVDAETIENALAKIPGIDRAFVQGHTSRSSHQRLIAYVLPEKAGDSRQHEQLNESWLRAQLSKRYPSYMIPARFITLSEIPLDANGKIARRNLPPPDKQRPVLNQVFVEPSTDTEKILAEIWREMLQLNQVGLDDDFFESGGDSMLAMSLPMAVEERIGVKLSDAAVLETRTVREMAHLVDRHVASRSLVSLQPKGSKRPFFCIHAHTGRVLEYRDLADWLGDDQPFYALQPKGYAGDSAPLATVEQMAAHYLEEIRKIQPHGPYRIGGYCMGALIAYEIACQRSRDRSPKDLIVLIDPDRPHLEGAGQRLVSEYFREFVRIPFSRQVNRVRRNARNFATRLRFGLQLGPVSAQNVARGPEQGLIAPWNPSPSEIQRINSKAEQRYRPKAYDGDVTMIFVEPIENRREERHAAWSRLIKGNLQIIHLARLNSGSEYRHLFHAPYVTQLADALKELLGKE